MSEKIVKYEYEYGLCKRMHYRGLWCVRYEGVPGHFEKAGMACACAVDGCDKDCAVTVSYTHLEIIRAKWVVPSFKKQWIAFFYMLSDMIYQRAFRVTLSLIHI